MMAASLPVLELSEGLAQEGKMRREESQSHLRMFPSYPAVPRAQLFKGFAEIVSAPGEILAQTQSSQFGGFFVVIFVFVLFF